MVSAVNGVTSAVAWLSLFLSIVALAINMRANRLARRARERSVWDDEQLLRTAWLQEIEARGQTLLDEFAEAERHLQERMAATAADVFPQIYDTDVTQRQESGSATEHPLPDATVDPPSIVVPDMADDAAAPGSSNSHDTAPHEASDGSLVDGDALSDPVAVRRRIHQLAADGHDVADIARRLNRGGGEVELILSLRPRNDDK